MQSIPGGQVELLSETGEGLGEGDGEPGLGDAVPEKMTSSRMRLA